MKAEEILIKIYGCKDLEDLKKCFLDNTESLSMILQAMKEYASEVNLAIDSMEFLVWQQSCDVERKMHSNVYVWNDMLYRREFMLEQFNKSQNKK